MGYVQSVLQPDEKVTYETKLSWATYIPGLLLLLAALVVYLLLRAWLTSPVWANTVGLIITAGAIALLAREWFQRWTTEVAITNRRIILKRGFIRRDTIEMSVEKVESIDVKQSLLGRLLDYGDVTVRGTGTGFAPMRTIDKPLEFRSRVTAQ